MSEENIIVMVFREKEAPKTDDWISIYKIPEENLNLINVALEKITNW